MRGVIREDKIYFEYTASYSHRRPTSRTFTSVCFQKYTSDIAHGHLSNASSPNHVLCFNIISVFTTHHVYLGDIKRFCKRHFVRLQNTGTFYCWKYLFRFEKELNTLHTCHYTTLTVRDDLKNYSWRAVVFKFAD